MGNRTRFRKLARISFFAALAGLAGGVACAQQAPAPAAPPAQDASPFLEEARKNAAAPCIEPPPMVRIEDYDGPLQKVVGTFARPLERKAVQPPHYKPGAKLCTLTLKGKFVLFLQDSVDPVTFLDSAFNAGLPGARQRRQTLAPCGGALGRGSPR